MDASSRVSGRVGGKVGGGGKKMEGAACSAFIGGGGGWPTRQRRRGRRGGRTGREGHNTGTSPTFSFWNEGENNNNSANPIQFLTNPYEMNTLRNLA